MIFSKKNIAFALAVGLSLPLAVSTATAAESAAHSHTVAAPSKITDTTKTTDKKAAKPKTKLKVAKTDTVIYVGDLHCAHCAKKIASKLYTVKGVVKVRTDLKADVAIISPQNKKKVDPKALWKAAKTSGFPALKLVGPTGTYVLDAKTKEPKLMPKKEVAPKTETAKS